MISRITETNLYTTIIEFPTKLNAEESSIDSTISPALNFLTFPPAIGPISIESAYSLKVV